MEKAPKGVWPTMITPFTDDGTIDYHALESLIQWYLDQKVTGLFAVCNSSESFTLSIEERLALASFVVKGVAGSIPVIAGGNYSTGIDAQAEELNRMADTGVDAVVILTSMPATENEEDTVWRERMASLLERVPSSATLGLYESPTPYHRILSLENLKWCVGTDRFLFLKDTSCDIRIIRERLAVVEGTRLQLFNANTETLLDSLQAGAAGYSSIMANVNPKLYNWLIGNFEKEPDAARRLSSYLSVADDLMVSQGYPTSAKYFLTLEELPLTLSTRLQTAFTADRRTFATIEHFRRLNLAYLQEYGS